MEQGEVTRVVNRGEKFQCRVQRCETIAGADGIEIAKGVILTGARRTGKIRCRERGVEAVAGRRVIDAGFPRDANVGADAGDGAASD